MQCDYGSGTSIFSQRCVDKDPKHGWVLSGTKALLKSQTMYTSSELENLKSEQEIFAEGDFVKKIRLRLTEEPFLISNFRISYNWGHSDPNSKSMDGPVVRHCLWPSKSMLK